MTRLKNEQPFEGLHYETGTLRNVFAHLGVTAPHTGRPISEALLMGISGGAVFGYFLFDYKGHMPMVSLLSRNTFDPLETLLTRLAVPREVRQTADAGKAMTNLREALEGGHPAVVWADTCTLYDAGASSADWWAMTPMVVLSIEDGQVCIVDRSRVPVTVPLDVFVAAWGRVKKDKHRLMILSAPNLTKLKDAVQQGIWQSVALFTEKPPKGAKTNFGFEAYRHWAAMLTNTRNPQGWARFFPAGAKYWAAMTGSGINPGLIGWIHTWGMGDGMERGAYADFLDEAAALLKRPRLKAAAEGFRASRLAWLELARIAMPDDVPLCRETRELIVERHRLSVQAGAAAPAREVMRARLDAIAATAASDFPLSDVALVALREEMSRQVMRIHDLEFEAVKAIQSAMR